MNPLPESTLNLLLSGLMGTFGGLFTLPINAVLSLWLKRNEQSYQHRLNLIAKQRELLLQHELEMKSKQQEILLQLKMNEINKREGDIEELRKVVERLQRRFPDE